MTAHKFRYHGPTQSCGGGCHVSVTQPTRSRVHAEPRHIVLGNPPWDRIKLQEKEFFAERRPDIAEAPNAAARGRLIRALEAEDPALLSSFRAAFRSADGESTLVRSTGRYPLCGMGDVNTYAVFAELNWSLLGPRGQAGFIVPSGIATDDTTKLFFAALLDAASLASLFSFENEEKVFPGVHNQFKFCLMTIGGAAVRTDQPEFVFFARQAHHLREDTRKFTLTAADFSLLNPNTRTCPVFRSHRDAETARAIYRRVPVLIDKSKGKAGNAWGMEFARLFDMSNDSGLFRTHAQLEGAGWALTGNVFRRGDERFLPLYEAKMVHHFNHRFGDYALKRPDYGKSDLPTPEDAILADPNYAPQPRYWVAEAELQDRLSGRWDRGWLLGWRDITNVVNERTVIAAVVPRVGVGNQYPLMFLRPPELGGHLAANLSSFILDYAARQKLGGSHLNFFSYEQLPVLPPQSYLEPAPWSPALTVGDWMRARVLELIYTSSDLAAFGSEIGYDGPPFPWTPDRRFQLRCELDAAFFLLYGAARADVEYIMDTFPIVRRADETRCGCYRTKAAVLKAYDELGLHPA